ncbi:MAG: hypothetical protein OSB22_02905, partial [Candidatus Poseidoniales archaeon]|nr:hypothetical protein [Candidatus Poseidoniales archaeon]
MSEDPPPLPPGFPPPPPPGFKEEDDEDSEEEQIPQPLPPPPGMMELEDREIAPESESSLEVPPPPPGFDSTPPLPVGFEEPNESEPEGEPEETSSLQDSLAALKGAVEDVAEEVFEAGSEVVGELAIGSASSAIDSAVEGIVEVSSEIVDSSKDIAEALSKPVVAAATHPHLRSTTEVDAILGDKLHATLSEIETSTLNSDGSVRRQSIEGELILRNSSKKHRAWDIEVLLSSTDSTDIGGRSISVRELEATEETVIPYSASGPRMLVLKEVMDTNPERDQEDSLSLIYSPEPQEIEMHIEVQNVSLVPLFEVEVSRDFPENFDIPDGQDYSISESSISWEIGRLNVGESRTLSLSPMVTTKGVEKISAGVVSANFSAEAAVSRVDFDRVSGSTLHMMRVDKVEDDRPGIWHCKSVFENRSSFVVTLSGVTVWLSGRDNPILDVSDLRQDVPPEGNWSSMEKRVEADTPSFTHEFRSSILPRVSVASTGAIGLKEQKLTVLDARLLKQYDKSRIKSFVSSDLEVTISIENTGSAPINVMRLLDDVPGVFEPPAESDVSIEIEGTELNEDQYLIEVIEGVQLEERLVSPDSSGNSLRITVGTSAPLGLQPGKTMVLRYPLHAPDPSPSNGLLAAPIRADFGSEKFGPVATRAVVRPPQLRVVHRRRNISTGKEVFPAGSAGRYEVLLMFINNSDSALDDLVLHDVVPGTFSIEKSTVRSSIDGECDTKMDKEAAPEGTHVEWKVGRIKQGERIEVTYEIQGDTESEYKVSDAQDFHGATFGDEVDEEPNVPEWLEEQNSPDPEP